MALVNGVNNLDILSLVFGRALFHGRGLLARTIMPRIFLSGPYGLQKIVQMAIQAARRTFMLEERTNESDRSLSEVIEFNGDRGR
jgi:hypothetical protein